MASVSSAERSILAVWFSITRGGIQAFPLPVNLNNAARSAAFIRISFEFGSTGDKTLSSECEIWSRFPLLQVKGQQALRLASALVIISVRVVQGKCRSWRIVASGLVLPLLFPLGKLDGMQKEETCGEVLNEGLQRMIERGNRVLQGLVACGPHVAVFEGQCLVYAFPVRIRDDGDFAGSQHHGCWYGHFHKQVLRCKGSAVGAEILHAICRDQENITVSCAQGVIQLQLGGQSLSPPQLQTEEFPASAVLPHMLVNIRGERLCADAVVAEPPAAWISTHPTMKPRKPRKSSSTPPRHT